MVLIPETECICDPCSDGVWNTDIQNGVAFLVEVDEFKEPGLGEVIAKVDFGSLKHWWWCRFIIGGIS